jgi:predicted dinucleotide-binding enzyme
LGFRDLANPDVIELLGHSEGELQALTVKEASDKADIITICVGFKQLQNVLNEIGTQKDKLIIETVNASFDGGKDAAGIIQAATDSKRIVKAFNSISAENLDDPVFNGIGAVTFICGGSDDDIRTVTMLAKQSTHQVGKPFINCLT